MHFLLDKEKSMPLTTILRVIENFLRIKITSNESDPFAMVLFNINIKKNKLELDGVNNLTDIHLQMLTLLKNSKRFIINVIQI